MKWLGDASYSVYLWHWPLVVVLLAVAPPEWMSLGKVSVLLATGVLAGATYRWVEPLGRRVRPKAPSWAALVAAGLVVAVVGGAGFMHAQHGRRATEALAIAQTRLGEGACDGAMALVSGNSCKNTWAGVTSVERTKATEYWHLPPECRGSGVAPGGVPEFLCDFSEGRARFETAYLTGDSHAQQWVRGVLYVAREMNWKIYVSFVGGCAVADVPYIGYTKPAGDGGKGCRAKAAALKDRVLTLKPDRVVYSIFAREEKVQTGPGEDAMGVWKRGLPVFWKAWAAKGIEVNILADPPVNVPARPATCLAQNMDDPRACAVSRARALTPDPLRVAHEGLDSPKIRLIDTTDAFCDRENCHAALGGVPIYFDGNHISGTYARSLGPYLKRLIVG
ncbi:acyltransferase family protein [Falsarthrobacter nasiphocae]|uniref:SGNH domain-containing protein n=1 Tax=Falsarthrobacter nasiphocae TaxID=189863 RepID=A0AAE3YFW3_9MICC|nr:SGNH hydrolase domain-containing protein [Falsarthrobacter nasiphocae]MDR6891409.1 hypothetical protein [Falsarthrobacter nasiphocae]